MNKLKYKFMMFMQGRYGIDQFYNFLLILYLVLLVINAFVHSLSINLAMLILLCYTFFRVFSKNIAARQKENAKYLIVKSKVKNRFNSIKKQINDKDHVYRKCPHCKAMLRFPKKKGKHNAICPKCKKELKVRI